MPNHLSIGFFMFINPSTTLYTQAAKKSPKRPWHTGLFLIEAMVQAGYGLL